MGKTKLTPKEVKQHKETYNSIKPRLVQVSKGEGLITCYRGMGLPNGVGSGEESQKVGTAENDITTTRLAYLIHRKELPARGREIITYCGDPTCCRPTHVVSDSTRYARERICCPGWITSSHYPDLLFDACPHEPKCIKVTRLEDLESQPKSTAIIDKNIENDPAWSKGLPGKVDEEGFSDYARNFVAEHGMVPPREKKEKKEKKKKEKAEKTQNPPVNKRKDPPDSMVVYSNEPLPKKKVKQTPKEDPPPPPLPPPHPAFPSLPKTYIDRTKVTRKYYIENSDYENPKVDVTVRPKYHNTRARKRKPPEEPEESEEENPPEPPQPPEEPEESEEESKEESKEEESDEESPESEEEVEEPQQKFGRRKNRKRK